MKDRITAVRLGKEKAAGELKVVTDEIQAEVRKFDVYLDKDQQKKQTPFAWYVTPALEEVEAERDERAALGTGQPYNRQIP